MADAGTIVAYVSLVISIIAFVIAVAQALQQYISTADGYRKCQESVMGPWVKHTRRIFVWSEVRFSVQFHTPVLFVASVGNDRGPVQGAAIWDIDGTPGSRLATMTKDLDAKVASKSEDGKPSRVHTADDERATWVTLLHILQRSEHESREWDSKRLLTPKGQKHDPPQYTAIVQVQGRPRNWDFMPDAITRPYGISTISHIAEMGAMLGMHWRMFDPDNGNIRAEGNGLAITSSEVQGLGMVVSFLVVGRSKFEDHKPIPTPSLKDLLFGTVPTVFKGHDLNFGDDRGIRRTLKYLKCKQTTFILHSRVQKHLRSVNFEVVAMLGRVFRLRGSNFKILPNPTRDPWVDTFSSCNLMRQFQRNIQELAKRPRISAQVDSIRNIWKESLVDVWQNTEKAIDIDMREAVHDVLDHCDAELLKLGADRVLPVVGAHVAVVLEELDKPESVLTTLDSDSEAALVDHYFREIRPEVMKTAELREHESPATISPLEPGQSREDIWLLLQFRMCCWWTLHEFDQEDVVALQPRWKGSRLPVMIL